MQEKLLSESCGSLDPSAPVTVEGSTPVSAAIERMRKEHFGCLLVVEDGELVGIFTERDVLQRVALRDTVGDAPVEEFMTVSPECLSPDTPLAYALNRMSVGGYRHVPLVDQENRPVGVISVRDIVDYIVEQYPQEVFNLPPEPMRSIRTREGA